MKDKIKRTLENNEKYMTLEDTRQLFEVMFETRMRKSNFDAPRIFIFIVYDVSLHNIERVFDNYLSAHKYVQERGRGRLMTIYGMEVEK